LFSWRSRVFVLLRLLGSGASPVPPFGSSFCFAPWSFFLAVRYSLVFRCRPNLVSFFLGFSPLLFSSPPLHFRRLARDHFPSTELFLTILLSFCWGGVGGTFFFLLPYPPFRRPAISVGCRGGFFDNPPSSPVFVPLSPPSFILHQMKGPKVFYTNPPSNFGRRGERFHLPTDFQPNWSFFQLFRSLRLGSSLNPLFSKMDFPPTFFFCLCIGRCHRVERTCARRFFFYETLLDGCFCWSCSFSLFFCRTRLFFCLHPPCPPPLSPPCFSLFL